MNNLLPSTVKLHQKYDLKGSTYKRKASKYERKKESPTYKDLDFMLQHPEGIYLETETYNALIKTMQRDCRVLESFKIMDYSLLVGIYNLDLARQEKEERLREQANHQAELAAQELSQNNQSSQNAKLSRSKSINKQRIAAYSTALESIQADIEPIDEEEDSPSVISELVAWMCVRALKLLLKLTLIDWAAFLHETQREKDFYFSLE